MLRQEKENVVKAMIDHLGRSKAAFVVDFKGLNVEQVTTFRKKLRGINAEMKVVRNTLARRALTSDSKRESVFKDQLTGSNAFVFAYDDITAAAKLITDFAKDNEKLQVKIAEMDGQALDKSRIEALASLPSKDVLRAQFLGLLQAPMSKFVGTLAAVPGGFARVLNAHKQKLGA